MRMGADHQAGLAVEMMREVASLIDVWQPDLHLFREDEPAFTAIFQQGRFWHYEAPGEQRELDPLGYYRMKPWVAFQTGMTGGGEKPAAAWSPEQVADFLLESLSKGDFYILCPDNDVTRAMDEKRMAWHMGDIIENRPALSRWHPDYKDAFAAFMAGS